MSRITELFQELREKRRKAFMPFVTAGDPDLDFTTSVIRELVKRGSSLCELGIAYSDPIADGPVIQASYTRVLNTRIHLTDILAAVKEMTSTVSAPIVTMVSYSIIYRQGLQQYVDMATAAGVAGAIVPDLPVEEAGKLAQVCQQSDFCLIQLVTPTTKPDRALRIAETSTGFLYYVSVTGITGERNELPSDILDNVAWLRERTTLPICVGFGISRPEHVRLLAPVADGVIVGSAIVRRLEQVEASNRSELIRDIGDYAEQLMDALNSA